MTDRKADILQNLAIARGWASVRKDLEPWVYGWVDADYRHSGKAAIATSYGPVSFTVEGISALEAAVNELWKSPAIQRRWYLEDLWPVCASLVASLIEAPSNEVAQLIAESLNSIQSPSQTMVSFALANVRWQAAPLLIAGLVVGRVDERWRAELDKSAQGRPVPPQDDKYLWWLRKDADVIGSAGWFDEQLHKAIEVAEFRFETLMSVALVCVSDLAEMGLYSGRGATHRPGVRGLVIDRGSLKLLAEQVPEVSHELAAATFVAGAFGRQPIFRWFGEDPLPLDDLLKTRVVRERVEKAALAVDSAWRRLATAARWHAKAFWADELSDTALACGIGFDALLAERGGSPGRVLAERFALLEPRLDQRRERAKQFSKLYELRSAVAHGSSKSTTAVEVRSMAADLRWASVRYMDLIELNSVRTEDDHREMFDRLKWG